MRKTCKHHYENSHFFRLENLFEDYLGHRIGHASPHSTFKRYLVSRNERFYCDLFDDLRFGRTTCHQEFLWRNHTYAFNISMGSVVDPFSQQRLLQRLN